MNLSGHDLTIGYRDRIVGRHLSIALATGEVLALLGPNGCGKTTLLKTLLGLLVPRSGEVRLDDRSLPDYSSRARARLIAYVPQSHIATFAFNVETIVLRAVPPMVIFSAVPAPLIALLPRKRWSVSAFRT